MTSAVSRTPQHLAGDIDAQYAQDGYNSPCSERPHPPGGVDVQMDRGLAGCIRPKRAV